MNPYKKLENTYTSRIAQLYNGQQFSFSFDLLKDSLFCIFIWIRIGNLPPHIFAIADSAYRNMTDAATSLINQSIIISGESGAGKVIDSFICA